MLNALHIGEVLVRDVLVPPDEVVALSTDVDPEENFTRMEESTHTDTPSSATTSPISGASSTCQS